MQIPRNYDLPPPTQKTYSKDSHFKMCKFQYDQNHSLINYLPASMDANEWLISVKQPKFTEIRKPSRHSTFYTRKRQEEKAIFQVASSSSKCRLHKREKISHEIYMTSSSSVKYLFQLLKQSRGHEVANLALFWYRVILKKCFGK